MNIPIAKPLFDECEKAAVIKPIESGWIVQGRYVREFEELFAKYIGSKYAFATSNCTAALHMAFEAIGIRPGDKVVIPSFTYAATANAAELAGAEIVFCDISLDTFNICTDSLKTILHNDTENNIKAIAPVNLFGLCSDMPEIINLAREFNLKVIEDSACGFQAYIKDKHSGTFGDMGCFSFHPRKAITTGEGGMIVTDNPAYAKSIEKIRNHGAEPGTAKHSFLLPDFNIRGYNYRMTDIQGAIGVCQMAKADFILKRKKQIAKIYNDLLRKSPLLNPPSVPKGYSHGYQSYVCLYHGGRSLEDISISEINMLSEQRNNCMQQLAKAGISTRQGTHAVHNLNYYKKKYELSEERCRNTYAAERLSLALPLYPSMTDKELNYVLEHLEKTFLN